MPPLFVEPKLKRRPINGKFGVYYTVKSVRSELQPSVVNVGGSVVPLAGVLVQSPNGAHVVGTIVVASVASLIQRIDNRFRLDPELARVEENSNPSYRMSDPADMVETVSKLSRTLYRRGVAKGTVASGTFAAKMLELNASLSPEVTAGVVVGYGAASALDFVRGNNLRRVRIAVAETEDVVGIGRLFAPHIRGPKMFRGFNS